MRRTTAAMFTLILMLVGAIPASGASADRKPPRVGFTTQDDEVLVPAGGDTSASAVQGWAKDRKSGIRRVTVTYCPGHKGSDGSWTCTSTGTTARPSSVRAALSCNKARRSCTWNAAVPLTPGSYLVFAEAVDRAGHTRSAGPIEVYVA